MRWQNKDRIKFSFQKLKGVRANYYLWWLVPQGRILSKYSDRMFESLRKWAHNIIETGVKSEVGEEIQNADEGSNGVDQNLVSQILQ